VHIEGDLAYVTGGLGVAIVDISTPAAPTLVSKANEQLIKMTHRWSSKRENLWRRSYNYPW